jgi:hypothetical protein
VVETGSWTGASELPQILDRAADVARVTRAVNEAELNLSAALASGYITRENAVRALIGTERITSRAEAEAIIGRAEEVARNATGASATHLARARAFYVLQNSCFVAGTPLLTPTGDKPVEEFRTGDLILSRAENDPEGVPEAKAVEETFVRVAPIIALRVGGRTIRTTAEHPFYVNGRWICAKEIEPGDQVLSHDGQLVTVEAVTDLEGVATVYNLRVSDYHTYFVGSREWGFSVWAHNANYQWSALSVIF